jgi:hypothetical protein
MQKTELDSKKQFSKRMRQGGNSAAEIGAGIQKKGA